jgi:1-pyrroline-5-carboxylate dehydrogenase
VHDAVSDTLMQKIFNLKKHCVMSDLTLDSYKNEEYLDFSDPTIDTAQRKAIDEVRSDFGKTYQLYINGESVNGDSGTFESTNPSNTGEVIGTFQMASTDQALGALDHAWNAFESWQYVPAKERADYLFKAADVIRRRRMEINA